MLRCHVTDNACGTDAVMLGHNCKCPACIAYDNWLTAKGKLDLMQEYVKVMFKAHNSSKLAQG